MSPLVAVVGAGAWGTALAQAAALGGNAVRLCTRDAEAADAINRLHRNLPYLGDIPLHDAIAAQAGLGGLGAADLVILAVPAQATRGTLSAIGAEALAGRPVVLAAKGLERGTHARQSEILAEVAPGAIPYVLSGPSFAADVAAGRPTAVTLAGHDPDAAADIARLLAGPSFRPYAAGDIIGVELAGALKNVYALGCGAVEGARLGLSARAGMLARAFAELTRLVAAAGGAATTLTGLAGLGDLILSCTSSQSRNYRFGLGLGAGGTAASVADSGVGLCEGVYTTPVAASLAARLGVEAPLIDAVALLLQGSLGVEAIVAGLMARPLKRED